MMDMGYPLHLIDLLAKLYRKQLNKVKVVGTLSEWEWFGVKKGVWQGCVWQGCVLSPYLFNILVEMVIRKTIDGFQGGLQIEGRIVTNLRYDDDIILLETFEAELQAQIQPTYQRRQDQDNGEQRHSVLHTHSEWATGAGEYISVPWVPDYRRWWMYYGIPYRAEQGQAIGASLQKIWKSHSIPISTKIRLIKVLVWPVATYGCESWTLSQKEWRNTSWRLWDEMDEKDSEGFLDSKENKWVGS